MRLRRQKRGVQIRTRLLSISPFWSLHQMADVHRLSEGFSSFWPSPRPRWNYSEQTFQMEIVVEGLSVTWCLPTAAPACPPPAPAGGIAPRATRGTGRMPRTRTCSTRQARLISLLSPFCSDLFCRVGKLVSGASLRGRKMQKQSSKTPLGNVMQLPFSVR